ncbi:hypothetical protein BaRGS_00004778 [Batillaria attramentaria]|uniref:Uncharacterized protein n=1 Tax=Batillaria attramentaria TaxID=370345 RepID=A0ABD0LY35_9CAEN
MNDRVPYGNPFGKQAYTHNSKQNAEEDDVAVYKHVNEIEQLPILSVLFTGHTPLMLAILNNNADLARHLSASTRTDVSLKDRNGMSALHLAVALGQVEVARAILQRNTANINSKERCMGRTPLHFACALTANNREDVIMSGDFTSFNHASPSDGADSDYDIPSASTSASTDVSNKETANDRQNGNSTNGLVNDSNESETTDDNGNASSSNGADAHDEAPLSTMADHETKPDDHPTETKGHKPLEHTRSKTPRNGLRHGRESDRSSHKNLTPTGGKTTGNTKPGNKLRLLASLTTPYHERPRPSAEKYKARPATASARLSTRRVSSGQQRRGFSPRLSVASLHHGLSTLNSHNRRDSTVSFVLTPSNVGTVRCKMVSLLLDHGADANLMTQFRKSALHMAAMLGDANVMALLLPETTNPNMLSASNKTALHLAVEGGHTPNVSQLIHAGANLGLRDMEGMTPLHMAAKLGHADMVTMLLRAKADKNSSDFKQMTPLHHACKNGHTDVTDILLRAGCRTDLVDDQGVLALDYRDNCIAEKDEKEDVGGSDVTPSVLPEETKMEPRRQRKKGAVFLPPAMLPTHAELE